jgi:AGAP009688-PA (fragment)
LTSHKKTNCLALLIRIVWNHITSIGDKAFYDLDNLTWLDLSGNRIKKVGLDTFALHSASEKPIQIDLDQNELTSNSFENGSFIKIHRPTVLYIRSNSIDYLAENIFLPLLKLPSFRLFPHGNNFICDCNNRWILKEKLITQDQFDDILCEDGQSLWTKDLNDIKFCDLTQEDVKTGLIQLAKFLSTFKIISKAHEKHISSLMKV